MHENDDAEGPTQLPPTSEAPLQLTHAEFDHRWPTIGSAVGQVAAEKFIKQVPRFFE
jgi:hypothetical protein